MIISIVSIVFIVIDAINSVNSMNRIDCINRMDRMDRIDCISCIDRIDRINCIDPGVLNYCALQLKDNSNEPTKSGIIFWVKKGNFLRLLAVTGICKYFTRSV